MRTPEARRTAAAAAIAFAIAAAVAPSSGRAANFDEAAAKATFKRNDCGKCHAPDRDKKGPALKKVAKELNAKPDGVDRALKNITTNPKVKLLDSGKEEEHKAIDTKDMNEIKNLIAWVLSH